MNIPHPDHPVWRRLVTGEMLFQPSFLGACMFLAHVRAERRDPKARVRTTFQMEQLRTLYAQNQDCGSARRDLATLRMNEIFMADPDCGGWFKEETRSAALGIPAPDHPVWHRLVTGEALFQPTFLGACMLLTHARADRRLPGGESEAALHTGQLRTLYAQNMECDSVQRDLARLRTSEIFAADPDCGGWFRAEGRPRRAVDIPPADHPVWQELVTGDVRFQPSFLGASLLLAHVRAELRQPGRSSCTALHPGQLRALYAHNVECGSVQRDILRLLVSRAPRGRPPSRRRRKGYTMRVVALAGGGEHDLPADTVTRDEPAPGRPGPYVPLAFRLLGDVFYVHSPRWSALEGIPLCLKSAAEGWA
jgi:hypothetical protein